jgi:hypothetical protein
MNGRIGGRIGASMRPDGYEANGLWRLGDVYAAIRGLYGYDLYGMTGWPRNSIEIGWPSTGYWPYNLMDYVDATGSGTGTFSAVITPSPESLPFTYVWEKSDDDGATWATVPGSSGDDSTAGYYYSQRTVGLEVTSQTASNDGDLYRLVVTNGLKSVRSSPGTLRYDTVSAVWSYQPVGQVKSVGQSVSFYAAASIVGNTYGGTYSFPSKQWQRSTDGGSTWDSFGGTANSTQSFIVASGDNNSLYRLSLTFDSQTFYSNSALLVVS